MRIGILLTTLASLTLACAATGGDAGTADVVILDEAEAAADLKADTGSLAPSEEGDVLRAIDAACAASWCRGDYSYRFTRLACDFAAERCTLLAAALPSGRDAAYPRACRIRGLFAVDDLVVRTGAEATLKPSFADRVGTCITKWATTLR